MVGVIIKQIKELGWSSILTAILLLISMIGGLPDFFSYSLYIAVGISFVSSSVKSIKLEKIFLLFLLYLPINLLLTRPDSVFRSWERLALFIMVFITMSSMNNAIKPCEFRRATFRTVTLGCVLLALGSFVAYFLNINFMTSIYEDGFIEDYKGIGGHFSGLTSHSMILGPVSSIAGLYLFYKFLTKRNKYFLFLLVPCIGSLFFSASRGSLIAFVFAIIVMLYCNSNSKVQFTKRLFVIFVLLAVTFPIWKGITADMANKQSGRKESGGMFDSRSLKFEARWTEFVGHPFFGVGFASIDPQGKDSYNHVSGTIEPGSSWLSILSMLGIWGFILFFQIVRKTLKAAIGGRNIFELGLVSFFTIHFIIEGYILAAGGPLCSLAWLSLATAYDSRKKI